MALFDDLAVGSAAYRRLMESVLEPPDYSRSPPFGRIFGMPVRESPMFPYVSACAKCGGSGDGGEESTYCAKCSGSGATKIEGVMTGARMDGSLSPPQMTIITSPLPVKFPVGWPASVPVPLRQVPGIRSVSDNFGGGNR